MNDAKRKVFVTGGGGYVGSKLVPLLLHNNFSVIVYDTFWYGLDVFFNYRYYKIN
mgnify:CR=1 FL=1